MNPIETIGLSVLTVTPSNYKTKVNVNTQIIIEFNTDLDKKTIIDSFVLLEDIERQYTHKNEIDFREYTFVKGSVLYSGKNIVFTPNEQLNKNSRYILYIKPNAVRDVFGKTLKQKYVTIFDTESTAHDIRCEVLFPKADSIISSLDKVELTNIFEAKYLVQIAKTKTFETIIYENIESSNLIEKDFGIGDGLYYIRARSLNGDFGDTKSFSVKTYENTRPVDDDIDETFIYRPVEDEEIKVIETFLTGVNVSNKTNALYIKFQGILPLEDIDFYESSLNGLLSDEDDEDRIDKHGEVDGSFVVVHDEENNLTYVFFIPISI